jgi:NAD(P)-dependent dehydrogenase (short-subunit alcohol dehydrogenase family)
MGGHMSRLSGKIAVVLGGHDGIGGAIARRFAMEGATVYATSRRADEDDVPHGAGTVRARRVDASDAAALAAFFKAVHSEAGRVDVLAISAGISCAPVRRQGRDRDHAGRRVGGAGGLDRG